MSDFSLLLVDGGGDGPSECLGIVQSDAYLANTSILQILHCKDLGLGVRYRVQIYHKVNSVLRFSCLFSFAESLPLPLLFKPISPDRLSLLSAGEDLLGSFQ